MTATVNGLARIPLSIEPLSKKDYTSDQEVRWCPGCGDYSVLATFQSMIATLGIKRENSVIVSGIGCSSRFPYYVDSYGMHSIHGRAPAIATPRPRPHSETLSCVSKARVCRPRSPCGMLASCA